MAPTGDPTIPLLAIEMARLPSQVPVIVRFVLIFALGAGEDMVRAGTKLSTTKEELGPAATDVLPAASVIIPAAMVMLAVPLPVQLFRITVRVAVPVPVTALAHAAVPVTLTVTLLARTEAVVTPLPPVSANVKV